MSRLTVVRWATYGVFIAVIYPLPLWRYFLAIVVTVVAEHLLLAEDRVGDQ